MTTIPTITVTAAGAQPTPPATLLQRLIALVSATNPGYTATLPASLIEDLTSTMVAGLSLIDQAAVETINSLTPFAANPFILTQLGNMLGVPLGLATNTSVDVVFSGPPGFIIAVGFTVSDGTNQYTVQDGGVIGTGGVSVPLFCLATVSGSFAVPSGTVTQIVTSVPSGFVITVTNPQAGTPGAGAETQADYAMRVLQANLAASQGMDRYLKTLLANVSGVQTRLVSVRQQAGGGWEVICGGGDPYQVAYAIYTALFDISTLVGSIISITGVTNASNGVYTTNLNHGLVNAEVVNIINANPAIYNVAGTAHTATIINATAFSLGINTSGYTAAYIGSGVLEPNSRNETVTLIEYPDTYVVPFVNPPQQTVTMTVTWGTTAVNFVSSAAVQQLAAPAIASYVNSLAVGVPMNVNVMNSVFQAAVASVLPPQLLTTLTFAVSINGVGVLPTSGTEIISGDPESYFIANVTGVTIMQA